ncbi:f-box/lrr-repeat protein 4 [Citrus sinensis]|nr:f-box/lrr-repeat protein 4 [Citrus sinensis]
MGSLCINEVLRDDELRSILSRLEDDKDKERFGLVCKRWLHLQSTERKKLSVRAGPHMLRKIAARFSRLVELDLSQSVSRSFYPGVTDSDLAVIADGFKSLKLLNLQNCKAVAEGCQDLRSLHLAGCKSITDGTLQALSKNCHNLEELGLQGCTSISDSGVIDLVNGCQNIKFLDLNKCSNIGDNGISSVSKSCSSLKTLKLLDCYKVGDKSILSLAKFCKNLETLIIGGCRDISDESIKHLAASCKSSLKNLRMDWCLNISDSSLSCILSQCRNLEALDIGCCEEVTDAAFQDLGEVELSLKVLKVNCPKVTVVGIGNVLEKCASLEYIDVRSCPHVTQASCEEAGLQFPQCCKVNFAGCLFEPDVLL